MKDVLSRVGIGAATVDAIVPETVTAGDTVDVTVHVEGGDTEQDVDSIYFAVCTKYKTDESSRKGVVSKARLSESFTIDADEEREFETEIEIPRDTPVSVGHTQVWVETGLDIDWALDPDDTDYIDVQPGPHEEAVLDAFDDLGFRVREGHPVESERLFSGQRFVQEFEFVPRSGPFAGKVDEVEVVTHPTGEGVDCLLEVDKRGGLFEEALDVDERFDRFSVTSADADAVRDTLESRIERNT
ncbi:sporulation protein [Halobacterium litoreum]|uniref:Sporulation protein n=1 Tax=Halobacterium litoreum TaxID=2039234 RepID=A0ABD5NBE5_9EURY|nr:sporulation protein [Halobacterium litoreum]UHH14587.1 sporulation protein [Halobacterium litoreum]